MSKTNPAVGDIFKLKNKIYHIACTREIKDFFQTLHKDACFCVIKDEDKISVGWHKGSIIAANGIYLGKASASLINLFEINNENNPV